jgi:elongation factor G
VQTGDTICDEDHPVVWSRWFPDPVISVVIEPKTKGDQEKLGVALGKLTQEDPTFKVFSDPDTGQTIISGMGELHLEIIVDRLLREFNVAASVGRPEVAYKETILSSVAGGGTSCADGRPRPVRRRREIEVEPLPRWSGFVFENKIIGGGIPKETSRRSSRDSRGADTGVVAGYP